MPPTLGRQNPHQPGPEFRCLDVWTPKECSRISLFCSCKALRAYGQGFHPVRCGAAFSPPPPPYSVAGAFFFPGSIGFWLFDGSGSGKQQWQPVPAPLTAACWSQHQLGSVLLLLTKAGVEEEEPTTEFCGAAGPTRAAL